MADFQDAKQAAERFARSSREAYEKTLDHALEMRGRNFRLAYGMVSESVGEARRQVEANRALSAELVRRSEPQHDAMRVVVEESVDAWVDLAFAPLSLHRDGLAHALGGAR